MTYARARLWTGITGVGTLVTLATVLLATGAPERWLEGRGGTPGADALVLAALVGLSAFVVLPFDLLGGLILPRRFGRVAPSAAAFALNWLRGVLVLSAISTLSGTLLLVAGRSGGRPVALGAFIALAALMILVQEPLARLVGGLRRAPADIADKLGLKREHVVVLAGSDPGFSGGFTGASATMVLPAGWLERFRPSELALLIERRKQILASGAWRRALVLALLWNAVGFLAASYLPGAGVSTIAGLVTTALGFTLWTFIGLLALPTPSRRATVAADALVAQRPDKQRELVEAVQVLDGLQDDEPERAPGLETIFHPVPSVGNRRRALTQTVAQAKGAWHLARTALFLSHVGLSQLPRAVHCNVGRPELWVYLPTDG